MPSTGRQDMGDAPVIPVRPRTKSPVALVWLRWRRMADRLCVIAHDEKFSVGPRPEPRHPEDDRGGYVHPSRDLRPLPALNVIQGQLNNNPDSDPCNLFDVEPSQAAQSCQPIVHAQTHDAMLRETRRNQQGAAASHAERLRRGQKKQSALLEIDASDATAQSCQPIVHAQTHDAMLRETRRRQDPAAERLRRRQQKVQSSF